MTTQSQPGERPTSVPCRACGQPFDYCSSYYTGKHLLPPALCRECRAGRTTRLAHGLGRVVSVGTKFTFVECGGETFICFDLGDVPIGGEVRFVFDPLEQPAPGRHRVARNVRVP